MSLRSLGVALVATTVLVPAALALPAGFPELVVNGDFSDGMTGWTYSAAYGDPEVASFDTAGFGASDAFSEWPTQIVFTMPPPTVISQSIAVEAGRTYEVSFDMSATRTVNSFPWMNPGPVVESKLGGAVLARHDFGEIPSWTTARETFCDRYTATTSGTVTLEIVIHPVARAPFIGPPQCHVDDVSVRRTIGPTLRIAGDRAPGTSPLTVTGTPNARVAIFAGPLLEPGVKLPGTHGTWHLGAWFAGVALLDLDDRGEAQALFALPGGPGAAGIPVHYQALEFGLYGRVLGNHHNYGSR